MLPGNIDPRRPEKQQRYKPPPASNNAAPGEDLTPDYMNILDSQRKSMQTPRSDRFKVVKIESTEPFKRGRWKCMDFLDQSYAKVFQQNYNSNRSSEGGGGGGGGGRPPSPKNNETTKVHSCGSWSNTASHVDLQCSMLQIFYRQNSLENNHNQCSCSSNGQNVLMTSSASSSSFVCCDENRKFQNHVLMPGMVSSSIVGLDFPIEFNFIPDTPGHLPLIFKDHLHHSNNNQCHLECCCKNQTSNVDIQKFHQNMSSEQVTIQPTQISNYAQISPELIQKNLNVPPQELLNQNSTTINYVQNLNDPNKSVGRNYQNQQTSLIKEEQIIENQNGGTHKVQQILTTQQNYLPSSQANASADLNKTAYNPIYVNIQNLTCPQKSININDSKNLISDQQITSTSTTESPNSVVVALATANSRAQAQDSQNPKSNLENVCDSTTAETMAQQNNNNNQQNNVMNGSYVSHNLVQNSNETMPTEYFQNLVQNLDPNNPNLVQKFVVPNGNMVQNCVSPNGNNVHYIVYSSANSNSLQQTQTNTNNNCVPKSNPSNQNQQNFVPNNNNNGSYVQNIVQNTVNTSQNLITNNENVNLIQTSNGATNNQIVVTSKGNSNQNLSQINGNNSNPNLMQQNPEKITQNVNLYQGQISVVEASSCTYKQQQQQQQNGGPQSQEVTPIYQNSQNSIQNSLPSNTCIHAFLTEERALVANTNTNESSPGGKLVSNLPVDTKIEALMDLVKKHLKCTVMEDVNVLKHKILELKERIAQLEYENELLKNQYKRNSMQ